MFCPLCKAEYREGYTRCADCDVDLIPALPPQPDPPEPSTDDAGPEAVVLCQEDDPATLTAVLSALEERGIRFYEYPIHNPHARVDRPFPMKVWVGPLYEIRVAKSDLLAAQTILAEVLAKEPEDSESIPSEDEPAEATAPDDIGGDELLADSSSLAEVWSGEEGNVASFLTTAFRENGIPTRRESSEGEPARVRIFVPPEKLPRAREIVREVVEGAPPE
jgi:hypothetical protein